MTGASILSLLLAVAMLFLFASSHGHGVVAFMAVIGFFASVVSAIGNSKGTA